MYGPYAQSLAFVWLMEQDKRALARAKRYLLAGAAFYNRRSSARKTVNWYSCSRVSALVAYDWIHDQFSPTQRATFADAMFKHVKDALSGRAFGRQNRGGVTTGFYGVANLPWYVGLAFHKDGLNDAEAARLLRRGYADHLKLLRYRAKATGDDGGIGSVSAGYGLGFYPWAEFNFMHTYDSATGRAIEERFDHLSLLANWVVWNRLPGGQQFGLGDSTPGGRLRGHFMVTHMLQAAHFYGRRHPDRAKLAMWVRRELCKGAGHDNYWWPVAPLLLARCGQLPAPAGPDASWPNARNFENMGCVFMRSGWGEGDTHAVFVAGGSVNQHRHYAQGHFSIYRGGFLAIPSGTYGDRERSAHLTEYFYRTTASNSLLILADADTDQPPKVWGGPAGTLDGGQYLHEGKQIAFATNGAYSYAAVDMTEAYDPRKCRRAVRQFVFVHPDTFVIFDRVTSVRPDQKKVWLMHTAEEPAMAAGGRGFVASRGKGKLLCRTILPADARLGKIGGPGKEYWSAGAGRNFPSGTPKPLNGPWRVQVSPGKDRRKDAFLHVIRVGDSSLKTLGGVKAIAAPGRTGLRMSTAAGALEVTFNTAGPIGGHIEIAGKRPIREPLPTKVAPQAGISARPAAE